jgi:uncharacterized protein YndB with AHSA1/START domain
VATFSISVRINAPRERVFEMFADLRSAAGRIKAIDKIEMLTDGPVGKGTRFAETRSMFGRSHTETMEITEWNPPQSYTASAYSCGTRCITTFTFKADGAATIVDVVYTATPVTFFAKLMSFMLAVMISTCRKMFENDLADLKAAAEGNPSAPQPLAA